MCFVYYPQDLAKVLFIRCLFMQRNQVLCNGGLSACELRFDCETLTAIRGGDVQVMYAAAEQVLHEKFTTLLKQGDTTFRRSLSLIVVDESHTVYTWYAGPQEITTFTDK